AWAIENPEEAAEILLKYAPETDPDLVRASQEWLSPRYQDDAPRWGEQRREIWAEFADWMLEQGLIEKAVDPDAAFTNDYLPE
ncbi:MAG TPA: ABC transporter substrate-binding protein, partial [Chloroflexi bacterium]|nr:ABC transporter substrate-binding protein [Chloroflexota bacterium]